MQVTEGNTELSAGSLVIQGYDVSGKILSRGVPLKDTIIVLFEKQGVSQFIYYLLNCN